MPDAQPGTNVISRRRIDAILQLATRGLLALLRRAYALALMVLIIWLSWNAVRYLVVSLITPTRTPPQIVGLPRRLDEPMLHGQPTEWLGLASVENPRGPLAHYHRFDTWIQNDRFNDCARSGCHAPLPHSKRKEVRAFLNMHATSIHCGVCHMVNEQAPLPIEWYGMGDGRAGDPPALMSASAWMNQHSGGDVAREYSSTDQNLIVALLRKAAQQADNDPALRRSAERLANARAASRTFPQLLDEARQVIVRSFRGSYGSKLALRGSDGQPVLGHPGTQQAVQTFLAEGKSATAERREALLKAVHPLKRAEPLACHACHTRSQSLVDFAHLGYPPARVEALISSPISGMIERIGSGQPFYLPQVGAPPPASQP